MGKKSLDSLMRDLADPDVPPKSLRLERLNS